MTLNSIQHDMFLKLAEYIDTPTAVYYSMSSFILALEMLLENVEGEIMLF